MMQKNQVCAGVTYMQSSFTQYWEGTLERKNDNIGKLTTMAAMPMVNYGLTKKLNIIAGISYVSTKASMGTLHRMKGFQDASLDVKWKPYSLKKGKNTIAFFTVVGITTPLSNYVIDFLPMSIGLGSTNLTGRAIVDYQHDVFFATASASYSIRGNVKLDRNSYYTTTIHNTNEVEMPDMATYNFSTGIRVNNLIAEIMVTKINTLGGFDIRKNDMPFVSNRMNSTMLGINAKYILPFNEHIELVGGASTVLNGRNVGKSTGFDTGVFYIFSTKNKKSKA